MKPYAEMTKAELQALKKELSAKYREYQGKDLNRPAGSVHGNAGCADQRHGFNL